MNFQVKMLEKMSNIIYAWAFFHIMKKLLISEKIEIPLHDFPG